VPSSRRRATLSVTGFLVAFGFSGCASESDRYLAAREALDRAMVTTVLDVLTAPDELEIVSLAHRHVRDVPPERDFHGYAVLGRAPIVDSGLRVEVVVDFYQSAREAGGMFLCFMPHHGVHAVRGGAVVDLVICFHCLQYVLFDGQERPYGLLSPHAEPLFRRIVAEHHLPVELD